MALDIISLSQPPSVVAESITKRQKIILKEAMNNEGFVSWNSNAIIFSKYGQIKPHVFRRLRDMGLLHIESGGRHGGSHRTYCYLTGKGRAVALFLDMDITGH